MSDYKQTGDLIRREDAIHILACVLYAEASLRGEDAKMEDYIPEATAWMSDAPSAEPKTGWIPVSDIQKLQDILYMHIDSLEGTRNIVEAGMLSAWKEVAEYVDGMLGEDGEE